jgi:thiol-disulfide isomerase/thioredoxin
VSRLAHRLAAAAALLASASLLGAAAPTAGEAPSAGRLVNQAQQHLARGEIGPARDALVEAIRTDPWEGFAWHLLAQTVAYGQGQLPETEAVFESLAAQAKRRVERKIWLAYARIERHRPDRFIGLSVPWAADTLSELREIAGESKNPERVRYEALVAARSLLFLVRENQSAMQYGIAAWELRPDGLQGRISRLQRARMEKDAGTAQATCLSILRSDPWAVEACSELWSMGEAAALARNAILEEVRALESRALAEATPVLANEIMKFYRRSKETQRAARFQTAAKERWAEFAPVDNTDWWKSRIPKPPAAAPAASPDATPPPPPDLASDDVRALAAISDEAARRKQPVAWRRQAAARFAEAQPAIALQKGDAWKALLAAAAARAAEDRRLAELPEGREQHPFVGQPAPGLAVTTLDGDRVSLADLRGRVVLVDFWATWCGPCKQEMPELEAARQRMADVPVTMLMLSVDETSEPLDPFVKEAGYGFEVAHIGPSGPKQDWLVRGIPSLFVVGPDGVVRHQHQGFRRGIGEIVEKEVRALLSATVVGGLR